jgi:hypothetical protein
MLALCEQNNVTAAVLPSCLAVIVNEIEQADRSLVDDLSAEEDIISGNISGTVCHRG